MFGTPFDRTTQVFLAIASLSGLACLVLRGAGAALEALGDAATLLAVVAPQVIAGLIIGGLLQTLISRDWMERSFGRESGLRGLVLATVGGVITPTGPFAAFPLVYALWKAGADAGTLVAYLTGWAILGLHRIVVWELPFMGPEFALLRFVLCLPMPILGGWLARRLMRLPLFARATEGAP